MKLSAWLRRRKDPAEHALDGSEIENRRLIGGEQTRFYRGAKASDATCRPGGEFGGQLAPVASAAGVEVHMEEAEAYLRAGQIQDALDSLEIAVALDPHHARALHRLGQLLRKQGASERAIEPLERASRLESCELAVQLDYALALNECGRTEDAMRIYAGSMAEHPDQPAPLVNLGLIHLQQLGEPTRAETLFRQALSIDPSCVPALANLGLALHDQHRYADEMDHYRRSLDRCPDNIELRWNRALAQLAKGNFADGWIDYELRFARKEGRDLSRFPYPWWDGGAIDSTLVVLAEQGIGDEIMFASCLQELRRQASRVVLECAPRLAALFQRSFPQLTVRGMERTATPEWLRSFPDIAAKTAAGSLPRFFRCARSAFPAHAGYLCADPQRVEKYRSRLCAHGTSLNVGLSWQAGTLRTRAKLRSLELGRLLPLIGTAGARFVCLQHGLTAADKEAVRAMGMLVEDEALNDLDEQAALVRALDLVVTVDNTNAHLCGALGKPGWVLLHDSAEWRWSNTDRTSCWYPSLALFRCGRGEGWTPLLHELQQAMKLRAREHRADPMAVYPSHG